MKLSPETLHFSILSKGKNYKQRLGFIGDQKNLLAAYQVQDPRQEAVNILSLTLIDIVESKREL